MSINNLQKLGLLNTETPDLGEIAMGRESDYIAYCTSFSCTGSMSGMTKVAVSIRAGQKNCPKCGHALFHKRRKK